MTIAVVDSNQTATAVMEAQCIAVAVFDCTQAETIAVTFIDFQQFFANIEGQQVFVYTRKGKIFYGVMPGSADFQQREGNRPAVRSMV